jgi:hypothetical protein
MVIASEVAMKLLAAVRTSSPRPIPSAFNVRKMGVINYKGSGDITVMTELLTDLVLASR